MIQRRSCFVITLVLSVILFCSGVVYGITSTNVINNFQTGIVDIYLAEYQKVGVTETLWTDKTAILPGDRISKIPRIYNNGSDCYIRSRIIFPDTYTINETSIYGISKKWKRADDGYWYYTEVLPSGKNVDFFHGLLVPEDLPEGMQDGIFHIKIDVDAIQSKNFEPRFNTATPWGDVEILKCKKGYYDISTLKKADSQSFEIEYQGSSSKLIANKDDFFSNFPYLMPGDKYSESVKIKNTSNRKLKLYFHSEVIDDSELLEKIQLKITADINGKESVVYEGNLKAESITGDMLLGTIEKNANSDMFKFEISVPAEMNNRYSLLHSKVKWVFSAEPGKGDKPQKDPESDGLSPSRPSKDEQNPKTGDEMNLPLYFCFMLGSLALGVFSVYGLRRKGEEDV